MTLTEIVNTVLTALADYAVYLAAGVVIGLIIWAVRRFIKAGR